MVNTMTKLRELPDTTPPSTRASPVSALLMVPEKEEPSCSKLMTKLSSIPWAFTTVLQVPEMSTDGASPAVARRTGWPSSISPSTNVYRIRVSSWKRGPSVTMKLAAAPLCTVTTLGIPRMDAGTVVVAFRASPSGRPYSMAFRTP